MNRMKSESKKQFFIFLMVAYGVTCLMGLLTWYGSTVSVELSVFPTAQMLYPAAGVMFAYLLTKWQDDLLPRIFYICFLIITALMMICCVMAVIVPGEPISFNGQTMSIWYLISQYVIIAGSIFGWLTMLISRGERREEYGLKWKNWKKSLFCILVFLVLYFGRVILACVLEGETEMIGEIFANPMAWIYLFSLPFNFFFSFLVFFGEEYGWRYYLQPLLQRRFGMRRGVLLLGVVWGLWHIFLDFFFYTTPDRGIVMTIMQMITCLGLGIFFGWAYLKTDNIWVPIILHYLNNNLILLVSNEYSLDVMQNQQVSWEMIPPALLLNGVLFGMFILSKEFRKKEETTYEKTSVDL